MANLRSFPVLLLLVCLPILCFSCSPVRCDGDRRPPLVLELTDATFDAAISNHDYILVDFYTPWCGHCKRLSPELDAAAPGLAEKIPPIILAKVNVEKNAKTASRYNVRAYPTLKFFIKGFPVDYKGPRKAQALSSHLYKLSRPDLEVLTNEAELETFMQSYESDFPVFIVFGMQESAISSHLAKQYKSKAWFLVVEQFSEKSMQRFGFDKAPVIVALSLRGDVEVYYGPFEGGNNDEASRFIQLNLLPLVNEITTDSLRTLREHDDGRAIALAILRDDSSAQSESLIRLLRDLAPNNRDFIFAHVDSDRFPSFVGTFHIDNNSILPRLIIWDGLSIYFESSEGYNLDGERNQEYITMFLQEFKEGRAKQLKVKGPTFIESLRSFLAENILYIVLVVIVTIFSVQAIWGSADKDYIGISPRNYNGDTDRQNPSSSINDVDPTKEE